MVNLLRNNRIDFFFLSPVELAYYRQSHGGDDRWIGIPIEGLPPMSRPMSPVPGRRPARK